MRIPLVDIANVWILEVGHFTGDMIAAPCFASGGFSSLIPLPTRTILRAVDAQDSALSLPTSTSIGEGTIFEVTLWVISFIVNYTNFGYVDRRTGRPGSTVLLHRPLFFVSILGTPYLIS